jgi:hypothetical protein
LQEACLELIIVYYDHSIMDYKTRVIKAPSYIERKTDDSALLWDIAFYSSQDVFEINVLREQTTQMSSLPQQYLSFYRKL